MTPIALLTGLRDRGVELVVARGALRYRPWAAVTAVERAQLITHRAEIAELLMAVEPKPSESVWCRCAQLVVSRLADETQRRELLFDFEERAGVLEIEGGMSRTAAEREALAAVITRCHPPVDRRPPPCGKVSTRQRNRS